MSIDNKNISGSNSEGDDLTIKNIQPGVFNRVLIHKLSVFGVVMEENSGIKSLSKDELIAKFYSDLEQVKKHPNKHNMHKLTKILNAAKKLGLDVFKEEVLLQDLMKKAVQSYLQFNLVQAQKLLYNISLKLLTETLDEAKTLGIDVSKEEAILPDLMKKIVLSEAERAMKRAVKNPNKLSINLLEKALSKAKKLGLNITDLEGQLPDLMKKAVQSKLENDPKDTFEKSI